MAKESAKFFIEKGHLCIKDPNNIGKYLEVKAVRCIGKGRPYLLYPSVADQHLLLSTASRRAIDVKMVMRIPVANKFPGLKVPDDISTYELVTEPYVPPPKKPRPS